MRPSLASLERVAPMASALCAAALIALAGCDKKESDGVAIAKARNTLEAMNSGGSAAPASNRSERFAQAAKEVASITGTDPSAALAQALGGRRSSGRQSLRRLNTAKPMGTC